MMNSYFCTILIVVLTALSCDSTRKSKSQQRGQQYTDIDLASKKVPDALKSAEAIAHYLTDSILDEKGKARALHIWITHTIAYDINQLNTSYASEEQLIAATLAKRRGVCHHYAKVFQRMATAIGLKSMFITGYTRNNQSNKIADVAHAWNAVRIDSSYYMIDNTWAAGYLQNDSFSKNFREGYFLVPPKEFIKTHMPFDAFHQFLSNPISFFNFDAKNFIQLQTLGDYHFQDTLIHLKGLNTLEKHTAQYQDLKKVTTPNPLIREQITRTKIKIDNFKFNQIVKTYYLAQENIKKAFELNNEFILMIHTRKPKTELVEEEMRVIILESVQRYRQGIQLLARSKRNLASYESPKNKPQALASNIQKLEATSENLKKSLQLNALHADIKIQ